MVLQSHVACDVLCGMPAAAQQKCTDGEQYHHNLAHAKGTMHDIFGIAGFGQ